MACDQVGAGVTVERHSNRLAEGKVSGRRLNEGKHCDVGGRGVQQVGEGVWVLWEARVRGPEMDLWERGKGLICLGGA